MVWQLPYTVETPKVAYVARQYYPFPNRRISYQRVYVCNWNGKNRRTLSLPKQQCKSVAWVGSKRLIYEVDLRTDDNKTEIWTVLLDGSSPRKIANSGYCINFDDIFEQASDGYPIISKEKSSKVYTVSPLTGRIVPGRLSKNGWYDPMCGPDGVYKASQIVLNGPESQCTIKWNEGEISIISKGKTYTYSGMFFFSTWQPNSNNLWVRESVSRDEYKRWRVDWKHGKFEEMYSFGYNSDWRPDRKKFAYTTSRDISPYGPKKAVWTTELWVGDLKSGVTHKLLGGIVYYDCIAVQPSK